jgi:surface antigen
LGLLLITTKTPQATNQPPAYIVAAPRPDYERDVLAPLRRAQEEKAEAEHRAELARLADLNATADRLRPTGSIRNGYAYHQCTWYVASRIPVPASLGNANTWGPRLLAAGWRTGAPRRGAIAQTTAGYYGHVAVVEEVRGGLVRVSEYNYIPFAYSERWVRPGEFQYFF